MDLSGMSDGQLAGMAATNPLAIVELQRRKKERDAATAAAAEQKQYGDVRREAGAASGFAGQGEAGFGQLGAEAAAVRGRLGDIATGKTSISAEQLRQGLQQNLSAQRSMAASARPGSAPMAARTAAMNAGRLGAGMAGQQALAGIAERQAADQALGQMILGQRGQDLSAALGGRGQALQGYGQVMGDQTQRWGVQQQIDAAKVPWYERAAGMALGGLGAASGLGWQPLGK